METVLKGMLGVAVLMGLIWLALMCGKEEQRLNTTPKKRTVAQATKEWKVDEGTVLTNSNERCEFISGGNSYMITTPFQIIKEPDTILEKN